MAGLTWKVKLDDAITPGARSASGALGSLSAKLGEVRKRSAGAIAVKANTAGIDSAIPKLGLFARAVQSAGNMFGPGAAAGLMNVGRGLSAVGNAGGMLKGVMGGLASGAMMAVAAVLALGAAAAGLFAKVASMAVGAQAFKQSMMIAFEGNLRSASAAKSAWSEVGAIAIKTGIPLEDAATSFNQLISQGFGAEAASKLVRQMADLKTLNPAANIDGIARAIRQIKSTGKLQGDELMQLSEAGLSTDSVYAALEKRLGKTRAEVLKLQAAGKISSKDALAAIDDAIGKSTGGKAPGELAAEAASKTIAGQVQRLKTIGQVFLSDLPLDFSPLSGFLTKIGDVLTGPVGKELGASFSTAFNSLIAVIGRIEAKDIASTFKSISSALRGTAVVVTALADAVGAVRGAFAWLDEAKAKVEAFMGSTAALATGLPQLFSGLGSIMSQALWGMLGPIGAVIRTAWDLLKSIGDVDFSSIGSSLSAKGASLGSSFVSGIVGALTGGLGSVFAAASAIGDAMNGGTAASTQTASPSKTAARLGGFYVDGYIAPARSRLGEVYAAGAGLGGAANKGLASIRTASEIDAPRINRMREEPLRSTQVQQVSGASEDKQRMGTTQREGASFADIFPQMFADWRTPAESAAMPVPSAASIGTAAANVTNATTTNTRGDVNISLTANNADEGKMRAMITSTLRSLDIGGA